MALVAAMMVLALLAVLSLAGLSTSSLEVNIAANDREAKQAFYLCEAGLEAAKYEIVKGWGEGTGGGSLPNWTFTFDAATMPDAAKTGGALDWSTDRWENFTLADENGLEYRILDSDAGYVLTMQAPVPATPPKNGYARVFYRNRGPLVGGLSGDVAGNSITIDPPPGGWLDNMWDTYWIADANGNRYEILGSALNAGPPAEYTLTLSGTPTTGDFEILLSRSEADGAGTITMFGDPLLPAGNPGGPNGDWRSNNRDFDGNWYLLDAAGDLFAISDTRYESLPDRMVLTVGAPPDDSNDEVQLVTNPYLIDTTTDSVDLSAGLQVDYGAVTIGVTPTTSGRYMVSAVSGNTTTGNTKELRLDARLANGSQAQIGNWRLFR